MVLQMRAAIKLEWKPPSDWRINERDPQPFGQTAHGVNRLVLQREMPLNDIPTGDRQQPRRNLVMKGKQCDPAAINCERDQKGRAFMAFEARLTVAVDRANEVPDRRIGVLMHGLFLQSYGWTVNLIYKATVHY